MNLKKFLFLLYVSCHLMQIQSAPNYTYSQSKPDFGRIARLMTQEIDALLEPFKQTTAVRYRLQAYKEQQVVWAIEELQRDSTHLSSYELEIKSLDFARSIIYEFVKKETQSIIQETFHRLHTPHRIRTEIIIIVNDEIQEQFFARINKNQKISILLKELPNFIEERIIQLTRALI